MDESESKKSTEGLKMNSPVAKKPKKRSLVERELETNLTQKITSPVAIGDGASTSRYGRARRLKTDTDFCDTDKAVTLMIKSPKIEKSPKVIIEPTVHKMHAVNSPVKHESPKSLSADTKIDSQIENIYSENVSLSRFGSEEKVKTISPAMKYPKVYIRKDLIQNKDSEETPAMIKSIFSPVKSGGKSSNSHLNNILERSSEKYNLNSNSVPQCSTASVVKTLDFDNKKKTRKDTKDSKDTLAKSDLFELEAKCEYQVGDLAWARMGTYPFWPCIITREPQSQMFVRKKLFGRVEHYIIHVTFFGDNGRRSWIVDNMLRKFLGQLEFETARNGFTAEDKKKNSKLYAAFFVSEKKMPLWNVSVEEAEMMLREPKRLRIDILNDMLGKNSAKSCTKQKSGKITRTDSDVSLSESLYDSLFSEDDLKNDDADRSRNKTRNRSLDVSEVVTACLDNMAAKTGITKIQRQSHMDRWLQKAKSKTPEKSHFKIQIPVLRSDKPRQQKSENESKRNSSKRKSSNTTVKEKPYSLRKSACESQNNTLLHYQNEHDYSSNGRVNGNISDKSDTWDSDSENVAKVEFLSDINNEDNKNDVIIEQDINDVMYVDKDIKVNLEISGGDSNTENVQFSKTMSLQEDHNDSGIKNTVQIVAESSIDKVFVVENNDITMSEQDKLNVPEERDDPVYDNIDEKQNKSDDINVSKISVKESDIVDNNIKVDANVDCAMIDSIIQNSNNAMDNSEMVKIRNMENAFLGKHDLGGSDILTVPKSLSNKKIQDVPNDRISPRKNCDLNNISILTNGHSEEDELSLVYEDDDQDLFLNGSLNEEDLVNKSNLDASNIVGSGSLEDTSNNLSYSNLSENKDSLNVIETSSNKNMFQDSIYTKRRVSKRNVKKSKESNKTYKRSPRLRLQKTDQTKVISVENPKFLKYMEIKQDSVIDENPDLTKEEIVHYLFKTWQYEQGIEQTCQSNELETTPDSVEDTNVCNSHYSMEETSQMNYIKAMSEKKCENFPDNTLSTEHTSEAEKLMTVLPENTQLQCVDTNGKYVSQAEECQTRVNITVDTKLSNINTNKIEYTTNVKDVDIKPQSEDIPETRIQETSQVDELKTTEDILDINIREQAIQTNCLDILDDTKMPNMEISTEHESNVNELTSVPELPEITEDSNIQDSFEQTNVPNVDYMEEIVQVQGIKTTDEKLSSVDTNEIQDIMQLSKEKLFSDSIVSEDKFEESETDSQNIDNKVTEAQLSTHLEKDIPLEASFITPEFRNDVSKDSLDLQTGTNNLNGMKSIKNPEFIKYMQLKQDAIIEENPDLSEEEIVQYLYKTWLYEESELAKLTQSEDIEQLQENMDMDEDMDVIDAANGDSEGFETNNANDNLEELKSADAQLDDEDESSQERINILYEVNSDTSTISEVSSKSHKRSLRLKSRPIKQKDQKSMDHPEFLKYLELKQDVIIDENPTLTQDEIVSYLYKTWLYEESEQADKRSLDSIDMTCQVKGLETDYVPQRKTRNKPKKVNGICTNREKELLRELKDLGSDTSSIDSEILVVRPNRKLRPRVIYSPPTSPTMQNGHLDTDRLETAIKGKDIDDISINSECSDEPLHKVKLRSRTKESPKTSNYDGSQENNEIDDVKVINGDPTIFKRKLCLKIRPIAIANDGFNGPKQLMMEINTKEEFDVETSSVNSEISSVSSFSKLMIPTEALESPLNVQQEFIDSINKDDGPGPIINDEIHDETASINSEVLEAPLAKRKQKNTTEKGTRKTKQTDMNDPEFLSYIELKQDALMDEYPQLTQDEIVEYLYKTWLYEESNKSEIKKTDEIEQKNLVKGLNNENSEQPKKVRKKIKTDCTEGTMMDYVTKEKPKRNTVRQYYKEDCSDIEEQIQLFEIFRKKSSTVAKSDKEDPVPEVKTENGEVVTTDKIEEVQEGGTVVDVYDEVEMYFDKLTKPKPSLFKGLVREKVCEICESTGNLVKCKGCSAMFHVDCVKKEKQVVEVQTPSRGRKKKKKPRGRRPKSQDTELDSSHSDDKANISDEIPNISLEEELKFNVVADADNFEAQLAEKMKQMMESNDNNSCDSYSADEINWNNIEAGKCEIIAVKPKTKVEEPSYIDFKCNNCLEYDIPLCFVCKSAVSKKQNSVRQRCQIAHCNRYYHLDCLDHWPQTKLNAGETSKYKNEYVESITCPRHVCHTCVCDDPRGCKTRFSGDKLARCVRCPATYHTFTKCLPAGSKILTGSHIICPRHYEHRPGKVPCHVNTGWCFICALGGTLICCEYCPTSFHAECLNIDPPEGGYMCEDCETGRLPIYNEMVWVKLGHYRWWPGIILHPSEIPENIYSVKHSLGEFVVRFFGQYDHYWVNRGRVFPFQEGDSGRVSGQKSKLDAAFTTAMEHAQRACEIFKTAIPNDEETLDIASSLLPPHYVKLKVNKPLGSLIGRRVDIEESSLTPCDCNPLDPYPCGVYAQCLNRMLLTECGPSCLAGDRCNNRAFERREYPKMAPYHTQHRGWGLKTLEDIKAGQFVIEYVGELIDEEEFRRRMKRKHEIRDENFYFLTLDKERMIDAGPKGNLARFMNHCCEPNCETQKWTVLGDVRVGLFALYDIPANSELTFNYNLECAGIEKKRCLCGAKRCSGYMGAKPKQEEPGRKKTKVPAKRTYKKRKNTEESPSTAKPKNKVGRPPKPRELTDIEKDLLIIKNATNGLPSSDSESSGRILSVESEKNNRKALKRKRVSFSTEEAVFCDSPTLKKAKIDDVGD